MNSNSHFRRLDMDILVGLKSLFIFRFIICGDFLKSGFSLFPLIVLDCWAHLVSVRRDSVARKVVTTWLFFPPLRPTFFTHLKWFLSFRPHAFPPCPALRFLSFCSLAFPPCPLPILSFRPLLFLLVKE